MRRRSIRSRPKPRNAAERRAARWYRLRGYRVLDTNAWLAGNELDLVARRGLTVVFCEVKSKNGHRLRRSTRDGDPGEGEARASRRRGLARGPSGIQQSHHPLRRAGSSRAAARAGAERVLADRKARPAREQVRHGGDAGRALRGARPRALLVGAAASRAGADEARPSPASLPREVHPAARRGASRRHVPAGGRVLDPFAGSGTTLVQALESGLDATGVDLAAFNCLLMRGEDAPLQPLHARARSARRALAKVRRAEGRPARRLRTFGLVCAAGRRGAALLSGRSIGELRARGRAARRARPGGAVGPAHDALRPRFPARAAARAVLVLQAQARSAARSITRATSSAATRSTRSPG